MSTDQFDSAVKAVKELKDVSNENKLKLYALFKCANKGICDTPAPSSWNMVERKKWDSWKDASVRLKGDKEMAKSEYIDLVRSLGGNVGKAEATPPPPAPSTSPPPPPPPTMSSNVADLEAEIASLKSELLKYKDGILKHPSCTSFGRNYETPSSSSSPSTHPVVVKSGYLNKWKDRAIGWTGTKWGVRYITLTSDGTLKYSSNHNDVDAPRATLSLKHCAVKDDGSKKTKKEAFHVFSIYRRESNATSSPNEDNEDDIVPLMRFSTASSSEKESWMAYLTEGCASFTPPPRKPLPKGTLAPIYFANPSVSPNMTLYTKKSNDPKAAHTKQRNLATFQPSRPMHRNSKPSFLSEGGGNQNYRGLLNLAAIIFIVSNFRLIYDTMKKHGFLISIPNKDDFMEAPLKDFPAHTGTLLLNVFVLIAFVIEKELLSKRRIPEFLGLILHHLNASLALVVPTFIVWEFQPTPGSGVGLLMCAVILWMKLVSYFHANSDYRCSGPGQTGLSAALVSDVDETDAKLVYPQNLTLANLYYFWFAPTLTYQIAFPKAKHGVRPLYVAGLLLRLSITAALIVFLVKQTINPTVTKLVSEIQDGNVNPVIAAESLVKLAIPNTYVWLLIFYFYFHLFLNLLAELLCFGDRVFYKDWWNCTEVGSYWRLWNLPVHFWLIRHLYMPSIRKKVPSTVATGLVFLFSAVLHEFIISVPFHMVRCWSFLGMMGQMPLVFITKWLDKKFKGSSMGNVVFWLVFCVVGQPCAILLYAIDYAQLSNGESAASGGSGGVAVGIVQEVTEMVAEVGEL